MIDLILIIMLIVSLAKPDVLLSKKMKEKATDEQKKILTKNLRKIYAIIVAGIEVSFLMGHFESSAFMRQFEFVWIILAIVFIILLFVVFLPAIKEFSRIKKELN